jgi:peptidoglycan endopeptidase LytE
MLLALFLTTSLVACKETPSANSPTLPEIESPLPENGTNDGSNTGGSNDTNNNDNSNTGGSNSSTNGNGDSNSGTITPEKPVQPDPAPPKAEKATYIRCTGNNVNLRSGAGTSYAVLGQAEEGTMYAVIGKSGNWYKINYRNKTAYLYSEYAVAFGIEKSDDPEVEKVLEEGYKLLGTPYVYGAVRLHDGKGNFLKGFTVNKFDCSSLVQYAFYKGAGEILDVTTRSQVVQGKYVKKANLKRGDCIYFTNESRQYKTGVERIGHVAIYLGDNYILHTASDYARIEKMSSSRWNFYVETRRFL